MKVTTKMTRIEIVKEKIKRRKTKRKKDCLLVAIKI